MKKIRPFLAVLLLAALTLSLAACSGKDPSGPSADKPTGPSGSGDSETVYQAEFASLKGELGSWMEPLLFTDEGLYVSASVKVGTREFEGELAYKGSLDVYEDRLFFIGNDGSVRMLEGYRPAVLMEEQESFSNFYANSSIYGLAVNAEGKLVALEQASVSYFELPEGQEISGSEYYNYSRWQEGYFIRVLDTDGSEISGAPVAIEEGGYIYSRSILLDETGNALAADSSGLIAIAPDGSLAYTIRLGYDSTVDSLFRLGDGRICATVWGENGMVLQLVDLENRSMGESFYSPARYSYISPITGDDRYDFYYTSGTVFYGCDLETGTAQPVLNWLSCNVGYNGISARVAADGTITGIVSSWGSGVTPIPPEVFTLRLVPADSVPQKETLTMAGMYFYDDTLARVLAYNRSSQDYSIEVVDYSQYNTDDDYSAGRTKLLTEIISGNMPDILFLDSMPYTQLAAKGLLEDIYPWLEADGELKREDFLGNVFEALEVNGGLYQVCSSFTIMSVMGPSAKVGDTPGWTFEDMYAALAAMPEGCVPFAGSSKSEMLREWLSVDMGSYVDWSAGTCSFDSPEFAELLELVKRYGWEENWYENPDFDFSDSTANRLAEGRQLLMSGGLWALNIYALMSEYYYGPDAEVTYIGYPTRSGVGNAIQTMTGYAISSRSQHKQAAWDFLRGYLGEEYQREIRNIPVSRKVFEEQLTALGQPRYSTDVNGDPILDENGEKIPDPVPIYLPDGSYKVIDCLTQKQVDRLRELVTGTTGLYDPASTVFDIILPEVQAFFSGQKSAEDVAALIQSKVKIYINEQR